VEALLSVENLTKQYNGVVALNDVSFEITDGITGILGENGANDSDLPPIALPLIISDSRPVEAWA
jgi:ABC-type Na+ transport system ATPase subunit NatA